VSARNRTDNVVEVQARAAAEAERMPRINVVERVVGMKRQAVASLVQ
jgi:hypothetical protein